MLKNALLSLISIALGSSFIYLAVSIFLPINDYGWEGDQLTHSDDEIGYVPSKNVVAKHVTYPKYKVFTDSLGARISSPNELRSEPEILTIGGSFTWGHGVENEETFPYQLGQMTGKSVLNFGVPSYGSTTSFLLGKRHLNQNPKYVVYGYINEHQWRNISPVADTAGMLSRTVAFIDILGNTPQIRSAFPINIDRDSYTKTFLKHTFGLNDVRWTLSLLFADQLGYIFEAGRYHKNPALSPYIEAYLEAFRNKKTVKPKRIAALKLVLSKLAQAVRENGGKLIVTFIPSTWNIHGPDDVFWEATKNLKNSDDIFILDTTEEIRRLSQKEDVFIPNDGHLTPAGNKVVAEMIARIINQQENKNLLEKY